MDTNIWNILLITGIFLPYGYFISIINNIHNVPTLADSIDGGNITDNVHLYLYTNKKHNIPIILNMYNIYNISLLYTRPTKILIHGKASNGHDNELIEMKNELLKHEDRYNVIIVDYGNYAYLEYPVACVKTRFVGTYVGQILTALHHQNKIQLESIHILGRCLGAHVAGYIGRTVKIYSNRKIGRITGLDPAAPLFEEPTMLPENVHLDKDDATFIDVIHTSAGGFGFSKPIGHADFYPNGGFPTQPGCGHEVYPYYCSHTMAVVYYIQSINIFKFRSTLCNSWADFLTQRCFKMKSIRRLTQYARMGHHVDTLKARGKFYLSTD